MKPAAGALSVAIALASGCGRIGFDAATDSTGDGARAFDAARDGDGSIVVDTSPSCVNDLSNVGTADFEVSFTLQTTSGSKSALVHQRAPCGAATYYDIYLDGAGKVGFEIASGGSMAGSPSLTTVTDGMPHLIKCTRVGVSTGITVDNGVPNSQLGSTYSFGPLPALQIAGGHPCTGFSPLVGTVTNVCARLL